MTLNDNPRVNAGKRLWQLIDRRGKLINYSNARLNIEYENGVAARMFINPYIKSGKASKLIDRINKEITKIEKYLKQWK